MARPLRIYIPGASYHVYCRGNRKEPIFFSDRDRLAFLSKLDEMLTKFSNTCYAFCLMPNHFHLYFRIDQASLSSAMHYFNSSYSNWLKAKYKLTGHVFQGRFGCVLVDDAVYALFLSAYIHLNPVRAKICALPGAYRWSSYNDYFARRKSLLPTLDREFILRILHPESDKTLPLYEKYVREQMAGPSIKKFITQGIALGGEEFVRKLRAQINVKGNRREIAAAFRSERTPLTFEDVFRALKKALGGSGEKPSCLSAGATIQKAQNFLHGFYKNRSIDVSINDGREKANRNDSRELSNRNNPMTLLERNIVIYLAKKFCALTLAEIGRPWDLDYAAVAQLARRVERRRAFDPILNSVLSKADFLLRKLRSGHNF